MNNLSGFPKGHILIAWKVRGFTKLRFHFSNHKKPGTVSNLLYLYEDDEKLDQMKKYFGLLMANIFNCEKKKLKLEI